MRRQPQPGRARVFYENLETRKDAKDRVKKRKRNNEMREIDAVGGVPQEQEEAGRVP